MKNFLTLLTLAFSIFLCVACGDNTKYCSSLSFLLPQNDYQINTSLDLDDCIIVLPKNCDLDYEVSIDTNNAVIENNKLTFTQVGNVIVTAKIKSSNNSYITQSKTINVLPIPVYITDCSLTYSNLTVDYNNRDNITNPIMINSDATIVPTVSYSNDILTYDVSSGKIDITGSGICVVTLKYLVSENVYNEIFFTVNVTRYINNFNINGISGNTIKLFTGDIGKINYSLTPSTATIKPIFEVSNSLLSINENGEYAVGDASGETTLNVIFNVSESISQTKTYNIVIIKKVTTLNYCIKKNNVNVSNYFAVPISSETKYVYQLTMSADAPINKNNIILNGFSNIVVLNSTTNNDCAIYTFYFKESGNYNLSFKYLLNGYDKNNEVELNNVTLFVNDVVSDYTFKINGIEKEQYNLYINNPNSSSYVISSIINSNTTNILANPVIIECDGNSIDINENNINLLESGMATITISFVDGFLSAKTITICVNEYVQNMKVTINGNIISDNQIFDLDTIDGLIYLECEFRDSNNSLTYGEFSILFITNDVVADSDIIEISSNYFHSNLINKIGVGSQKVKIQCLTNQNLCIIFTLSTGV